MTSKHTAGPWKWQSDALDLDEVDELFQCEYPDGLRKYMDIGLVGGARGVDIIPLRIDHYDLEYDGDWISKADRDLIAAAPDMLEALEAVLTELDRHDIPMACRYRIEDSINKARGESDAK